FVELRRYGRKYTPPVDCHLIYSTCFVLNIISYTMYKVTMQQDRAFSSNKYCFEHSAVRYHRTFPRRNPA
ncbi:MAG: hypothetical protein QM647_18125, partial [Asticcacaulis sp.]|uniref:hypothetical protein n=1 Tax=Asticcacaulis sp. TaxID=1872648 RepID=UPI0039E4F547